MVQRSQVGNTFVMFDHDQAFNPAYKSLKQYLEILQWFIEEDQPHWRTDDFDPEIIFQTIQRVKELDIDQLLSSLPEKISPKLTRARLKSFLQATQRTIEKDVFTLYKVLTGDTLEMPKAKTGDFSLQQSV